MPKVKESAIDLDYITLQAISYRERYTRSMEKVFYTYETKLEFEGRLDQALDRLIYGNAKEVTL